MTNFYEQYASIEPYLKQKQPNTSEKENYQSVDDRKKLVSIAFVYSHRALPGFVYFNNLSDKDMSKEFGYIWVFQFWKTNIYS